MLRTNDTFLQYIEQLYHSRESITLKDFAKGRLLLQQGERTTKVLMIREGITKCFFNEENGKDYIVAFLGKGEMVGELEVIRNRECLCNVEALTPVQAYSIPPSLLNTLLSKEIKFNNLLLDAFAERIVNTSIRASFQQLYTAEHSLSKLLELQSKQHITLSKEDMAAYLGISLRSLNRALKDRK